MSVVAWVGTVACAAGARVAARHLRMRKLAEILREGRARAAVGSRYERAPAPSDDPFAPPPPPGATVLGDLVQNSVGRPPMTMRWFVTPDGTTFGCAGSLHRIPLVRLISTDGTTVWVTLSIPRRGVLAPTAPFVVDQQVGYRAGHDDGLRAHQELIAHATGLQSIRSLDELCEWLNAYNRRIVEHRANEDPQTLLEFDLRRYPSLAPALRRRLSPTLPEARLRA